MKKTSTLLLTALLMLFANLSFAANDNFIRPELIYPASGTSSTGIDHITVRVTHNYAAGNLPDVKMDLTSVYKSGTGNEAPAGLTYEINGIGSPTGTTAPVPVAPGYTDYTFRFTNANIDASSPFAIIVTDMKAAHNGDPNQTNSLTVSQNNPLPVELISFNAATKGPELTLNWATATEKNSNYFEVEESLNGSEFGTLGTVKANGNSNTVNTYSFKTKNNNAITYYRLKMVDLDGTFEYSKVISVSNAAVKNFALSINNSTINTQLNAEEKVARVVITDLKGQVIYDNSNPTQVIKTNYAGIGMVSILTNKNCYQTKTFIQQ